MAAAYAALVSLSHILNHILHPPPTHRFVIPTDQNKIETLLELVNSFINFLDNYHSKLSQEITQDLEERIVGAAHKAEDIIESYVVTQIQAKNNVHQESVKEEIKELIPSQKELKKIKSVYKFNSIRNELDEIRNKKGVEDVRPENSTGTRASSSRSFPGKNIMIGFKENLNHIRLALCTYEPGLQIIPVVGMGGIGKTTLATNVYKDAYIVQHFDVRAWVSISQEYTERLIILALLQQIYSNIEANELSADELGNLLHKQLFGRRYFIVLDDMWDVEAWEQLKLFLPDNGNGSRVLVTTRLFNLAVDFKSCTPYQVSLLNDECSWNLILEQVFGKDEDCPNELEEIGKNIARKCGGLPLALVVIGGLLAKSNKTREFWEYVEENVTTAANSENDEQCMKILRLSYCQLPIYIKPCFLYLAVFPKNVEIRMSRLIKLWVAEGFIKPINGKTLEEVAGGYVDDLIDRNLIMVEKQGLTGRVKSCGIHDLIRDLCIREIDRDKFLCIFDKLDKDNISPNMTRERHLSIHIGTTKEKPCKVLKSANSNRTFLSFSKWDSKRCVVDRTLNLLRVLEAVDLYSMDEILQLFNSRYITCGIPWEFRDVPSSISLLWNLQTLVVPGSLSLPSEIWKMTQLRHLKMPGITLPDPMQGESDSIVVLENLQTLSTVKDFIFREQVLKRIPNLNKLGIDCDATIKEMGYFCLSNLVFLYKLESLVLAFRGTWESMVFPTSLKKLSLSYCEIPWEDMSVVGSLPNLQVLKLQTLAAKGRTWNPNVDEFCRLRFLLIDQCEMETWEANDTHFPCLEHLHLVSMKMEEIPIEFAEIPTLQTIDLNYCSKSLFSSAKNISKERENIGYEEIQVRSFPKEALGLIKENVVGLEDEAALLIAYLTTETDQELDVISIVGMRGIGKTTLAHKIFDDPAVQYEFPTRIWLHVSKEFTMRNVCLAILKQLTGISHEYHETHEFVLAEMVARYLGSEKYLLVLDDVWKPEDWDRLQVALPKHNSRGKVLITSLSTEVGRYVNRSREPHTLRFLMPEDSCLLLQLEVFGKSKYPPELEDVGRRIANACRGLPFAIVVIGGILLKNFSKGAWEEVSDILTTFLDYDPTACMEQVISLSYKKLPYHLRKCFLYMGRFPQDFEIPAWRLICLWISEGLIQSNNDVSMEQTAEHYLEDLISRNLITADKLKASGKVKNCRIHDLLYDFCKTEAGNEMDGSFLELKLTRHRVLQPSVELNCIHLCVHSNVLSFPAVYPLYAPSVRSFVCFSMDKTTMEEVVVSAIFTEFKQLRVLDVSPIKFTELPIDMFQLHHLTYIALSGNLKVLPAAFSKFVNIQTLVVDTTSRTLDVKVDILSMLQLRHFRTNASSTLPKKDMNNKGGENIQTLRMISPESCTAEAFDRAQNLKKLGVRGKFLEDKNRLFGCLGRLENLEKLELLNDAYPLPPSKSALHVLAPAYKFPSKLRRLTLMATYLDWNYMSVLGSLENLEVLKLKDRAFWGESWKAADGGFRNLEVLHIDRTDLKLWEASHHHFPRLKWLKLRDCLDLQQVPVGLADVPNFQLLDLYHCRRAAASAMKIAEKKQEDHQQSGNGRQEFKLNIFPYE